MANARRGRGIESMADLAAQVIADPSEARGLLALCPVAAPTPLLNMPGLAAKIGVGQMHIKDESNRMGLGSFKALGAVHALAHMAVQRAGVESTELESALDSEVFVCASAGNHGLSVAAGARLFGARAVVYISDAVPEAFADRLRERGAEVVREGNGYEESMAASVAAAQDRNWTLLSDSSWPGYNELPARVMEGYLIAGSEVVEEIPEIPSHVFLQAGVGGFAAAMSALLREVWGTGPTIIVVEPDAARCLADSVAAGEPVESPGPVSAMGRLDCKEASHLALARLAIDADFFVTVSDGEAEEAVQLAREHGVATTPSGAAGLAAAMVPKSALGLTGSSHGLVFVTEGPEQMGGS